MSFWKQSHLCKHINKGIRTRSHIITGQEFCLFFRRNYGQKGWQRMCRKQKWRQAMQNTVLIWDTVAYLHTLHPPSPASFQFQRIPPIPARNTDIVLEPTGIGKLWLARSVCWCYKKNKLHTGHLWHSHMLPLIKINNREIKTVFVIQGRVTCWKSFLFLQFSPQSLKEIKTK